MALPFTTDQGAAGASAIGLIVLQADETVEPELGPVFARAGAALYHSRIPSAPEVTPETLRQMEADLPRTAALFPQARPLDVVGFGCTSGATLIGADRVAEAIRSVHPGAKVTDPMTSVVAACRHLGVTRIGFVTPYVPAVSQAMRALLEREGFEIAAFGSFEQIEERTVARIAEASVLDAVAAVGAEPEVEAVFASCTNLRSLGIIAEAEARTGKPVISSNLALGWHLLNLAGIRTAGAAPGRLFGRAAAASAS